MLQTFNDGSCWRIFLEFEDSSTTEEAPTPIVTLDSVNLQKLFDFPNPKAHILRTGEKSEWMEQMFLLEKMDVHRIKQNKKSKMVFILMNANIGDFY